MDSKLTLKLNENVIERAKQYASNKRLSLSRLIENYLDSLTREQNEDFEISPFVKSISSGKSIPVDADWKSLREDYVDFLEEKHK
jgi:antitoxin component of RelBE/YafQ-DinJ toxin-antitoxin module